MEALSRMIVVQWIGLLSGFSVWSRNNKEFLMSHLLFAENNLILSDGNSKKKLTICGVFSYVLKQFQD
jgi:hypothetical protein